MSKIFDSTYRMLNCFSLLFSAPSSAPIITEISAPTSSVISLSWKQPMYTNGPLLSYRLYLRPVNNDELHETSVEVPPNVKSWTFRQLKSSQEYVVAITACNQDGEGREETANMTTPGSGSCKCFYYIRSFWSSLNVGFFS